MRFIKHLLPVPQQRHFIPVPAPAQIITAMSLCASRNDRIAGKLKEENAVTSPGAILGLFAYEISPYNSCTAKAKRILNGC